MLAFSFIDTIAGIEEKYLSSGGAVSEKTFKKLIAEKKYELGILADKKLGFEIDANDYYGKFAVVMDKMQDLKAQWLALDFPGKQSFLKLVFGHNIVFDGRSIRTPYMHPIFSFKTQDIQGFELIDDKINSPEIGGINEMWS